MQVATVSAEVAAQSAIVNRFAGSLRAWTFQVDSGQDNRQFFVFPIDMHGPNGTRSPLARNALDVHLVCSPESRNFIGNCTKRPLRPLAGCRLPVGKWDRTGTWTPNMLL